MDLSTMERMNRLAESKSHQPIFISKEQIETNTVPKIPYTGETRDFKRWRTATLEEVDIPEVKYYADSDNPVRFFVYISGMGAEGEGAMTTHQLLNTISRIEEKYPHQFGYGLSFFGEFQGWVTVYKKITSHT